MSRKKWLIKMALYLVIVLPVIFLALQQLSLEPLLKIIVYLMAILSAPAFVGPYPKSTK
ncbi:hypothetical protein L1N85_19760 [Paenibacillus alkaliterrae]|uniref:hypothetical protein n=1 Tax=Paenibacillus alkaliterrae TaxID=320909 RepID=UPI001F2F5211|nr:hypothetical protein [Paenibacillus alkaliterrae]MCF2940633.1 hypothetical protein [Paenibacillus alkaliterrae]